jgi:hypothetical protein
MKKTAIYANQIEEIRSLLIQDITAILKEIGEYNLGYPLMMEPDSLLMDIYYVEKMDKVYATIEDRTGEEVTAGMNDQNFTVDELLGILQELERETASDVDKVQPIHYKKDL